MLLEADKRYPSGAAAEAWSECFSLVRQIPGSAPTRLNLPVDVWRNSAVCLGMAGLIALVTADIVDIATGGLLLLLLYLFIRAITVEQMLGSVKGSILLIIAGALCMAKGLENTGVVRFIAQVLMDAAAPLGSVGVIAMVYIISVFLSMFINNSATIAILAPMVTSIAQNSPDMSLELLVWTLVLAAGSCFTTPLGYQTNLMVMPDGQYEFTDFTRFGGLIQLVHGVLVIAFISILGPLLT